MLGHVRQPVTGPHRARDVVQELAVRVGVGGDEAELRAAKRIAEAYEPALTEAGITRDLDLAEGWVRGDLVLLQQTVANLLDNLIAHTPRGTRAKLAVAAAPDEVRLSLADDGPRAPAGAELRIFERFVRLDPARSGPGHGLGLSLASAVARAHGGRVEARNTAPGLRVSLTFPAVSAP